MLSHRVFFSRLAKRRSTMDGNPMYPGNTQSPYCLRFPLPRGLLVRGRGWTARRRRLAAGCVMSWCPRRISGRWRTGWLRRAASAEEVGSGAR